MDLIVKPHVGDSHAVLRQGAGFIRADGGGGSQSLHSLQILHQAVLTGHALGREGQTHLRDGNRQIEREERKQRTRTTEQKGEWLRQKLKGNGGGEKENRTEFLVILHFFIVWHNATSCINRTVLNQKEALRSKASTAQIGKAEWSETYST